MNSSFMHEYGHTIDSRAFGLLEIKSKTMKRIIIIACLVLPAIVSPAQMKLFENISLGISGGYTNYQTFTPEIFVQKNASLFQRPFEPKVGITYRDVETTFKEINRLKTNSIGLFAEAAIFPFHKYFFTGIRWELITLNWFTDEAQNESNSNLASTVFSGTNLYGIAGIDIPLFKNIGLRLYGMSGIQQYKVSDGSFSFGSYVHDGTIQENHTEFVYQLNAGIILHLK
jgi:hypothetical protein